MTPHERAARIVEILRRHQGDPVSWSDVNAFVEDEVRDSLRNDKESDSR